MIGTWELPVAVIGGAIAGSAVFLIVRELLPATPSLGPTLARLQPGGEAPVAARFEAALGSWGWLARYVTVPAKDLAILGKGTDAYLTSLGTSAIAGLVAPTVLVFALSLGGHRAALRAARPARTGLRRTVRVSRPSRRAAARRRSRGANSPAPSARTSISWFWS